MVFFAAGIAAQAAIMLPLLVVPDVEYGKNITSGRYETLFRVCSGLASVYNCAALFFCYRLLHPLSGAALREESYEKARIYTLVTTAYSAFLLVIWLFSDVIFALSQYLPYRSWNFQESVIDFLWLAAAGTVFLQTFMYMSYPELFHVPLVPEPELQAKALPKEELDDLKAKLDRFMRSGKPYLNARLTIEDLAEAMHLNTPTLSGLINEGYGKNFFDYINEYRIEEFIRLSGNDKYKNYTFLAVAFEAGFNSKTTFNRVFKKHTGKTPREYFGLPKDAQTAEV